MQKKNIKCFIIIALSNFRCIFAAQKSVRRNDLSFEGCLFLGANSVDVAQLEKEMREGNISEVFFRPRVFSTKETYISKDLLQSVLNDDKCAGQKPKYFFHIWTFSSLNDLKVTLRKSNHIFKLEKRTLNLGNVKKQIHHLTYRSGQDIGLFELLNNFHDMMQDEVPVFAVLNDVDSSKLKFCRSFIVFRNLNDQITFLLREEQIFSKKHFDTVKKCLTKDLDPNNKVYIYCCSQKYLQNSNLYQKNIDKISQRIGFDGRIFLKEINESGVGTISIFKHIFADIEPKCKVKNIEAFYSIQNQKQLRMNHPEKYEKIQNTPNLLIVIPNVLPVPKNRKNLNFVV